MKSWIKVFIILVIVLIAIFVGKIKSKNVEENVSEEQKIEVAIEEKEDEIKIFSGNDRPIAFMIDNNVNARPQSALNRAYLVYEIIVEGKETRLMALMKGVDVSKEDVNVGPIRSARHYFIDYALENDAIYTHLGQSPKSEDYFKNYDVNHINGQTYDTGKSRTDSSLFWRESTKKSPHNAYTSIKSVQEICKKNSYRTSSSKKSLLNYVTNEVKFDDENSKTANSVSIPYSDSNIVKYEYDESTGRYTRFSKGNKQIDEENGEDITTKNIIIEFIKNTPIDDGENKDRQELDNHTNVDGYYITNGRAINIRCKKEDVGKKTKYVDEDGNEIDINDGNTWINICPIDAKVEFE